MNLYCISGLGADKRMFQRLQFHPEVNVIHLDWLEPNKNETLGSYCFRFSKLIDPSKDFSILGLSFGGVIAIELAAFLCPRHIILLSSFSNRSELPLKYRVIGRLRLHKLVPTFFFKTPTRLTFWFFGARKPQEQNLLTIILQNTSPGFLKWAIDKVLTWQRSDTPDNVFHIHGTWDRIIPYKGAKADMAIPGAGHLMVYTHAEQVSRFINRELVMSIDR